MSRLTRQTLSIVDQMKAAGVDPFLTGQVQTLVRGYSSLRETCKRLHKDNTALRIKLGLKPFGKGEEE
jgi:hypothetical protein